MCDHLRDIVLVQFELLFFEADYRAVMSIDNRHGDKNEIGCDAQAVSALLRSWCNTSGRQLGFDR